MVKLVALKEVWYNGKTRRAGDEFEAGEMDAKILTAHDLGHPQKARKADDVYPPRPVAQPQKRTLTTAAIKAEEPAEQSKPADETTAPYSRTRRTYQRRDMTSED